MALADHKTTMDPSKYNRDHRGRRAREGPGAGGDRRGALRGPGADGAGRGQGAGEQPPDDPGAVSLAYLCCWDCGAGDGRVAMEVCCSHIHTCMHVRTATPRMKQGAGDGGPAPEQEAAQHLLQEEGEHHDRRIWCLDAATKFILILVSFCTPQKDGGIKFNSTVPLTKVRGGT